LIYVTKIRLDDGEEFPITFAGPEDDSDKYAGERATQMASPCFHDTDKKCVQGRLTKTQLTGNVFSGGAQGLAVLEDQKTAAHLALLTLVQDLASSTGINDIINQQNAGLHGKTYFEVHPDCKPISADNPVCQDDTDPTHKKFHVVRNWTIKPNASSTPPKSDATQPAAKGSASPAP
jgi:hypothetical protein